MVRVQATEQFSDIADMYDYLENYPLPAFPELKLLQEMEDVVPDIVPKGTTSKLFRYMADTFQKRLHDEFWGSTDSTEDPATVQAKRLQESIGEVSTMVRDTALRDIVYLAPGLLQSMEGDYSKLERAADLIARETLGIEKIDLIEAWDLLDSFLDEAESKSDVAVQYQDREDLFDSLLKEAEETEEWIVDEYQDILYDAITSATEWVEVILPETLDDLTERLNLNEEALAYLGMNREDLYGWEAFRKWYETKLVEQRSLPEKQKAPQRYIDVPYEQVR